MGYCLQMTGHCVSPSVEADHKDGLRSTGDPSSILPILRLRVLFPSDSSSAFLFIRFLLLQGR